MDEKEQCEHPKEFIRHKRKGIYICLLCEHESFLQDRPYYCYHCPGVHSLTWKEIQKHKAEFHPTPKHDEP